jgi:p38 MAP kinase
LAQLSTALQGISVLKRYSRLEPIGLGTFGMVCSALDSNSNDHVAIKKIANPFQNNVLAKRAFRELMLLSQLQHQNVFRNLIRLFVYAMYS